MIKILGISPGETLDMPARIDLRNWCSPIENQLQLGSCTAHAAVGIVEYYENRAFRKFIHGSRLFVYKTTRNLLGWAGDTGGFIRTTMAALALFGLPKEIYWPYTDRKNPGPAGLQTFDEEPSAFIYSMADNYEATKFFCHDPLSRNIPGKAVLESVKKYLNAGIPAMFGFYGFPSFKFTNVKGGIPFPCPGEEPVWGHAVVAVGYDDKMKIKNTRCNKETTGALLIRNSWGTTWGEDGYGWLPYDYVLNKYALDFWSLLNMNWINTSEFGL